jgi:hypothetical protein
MRLLFSMTLFVLAISTCVSALEPTTVLDFDLWAQTDQVLYYSNDMNQLRTHGDLIDFVSKHLSHQDDLLTEEIFEKLIDIMRLHRYKKDILTVLLDVDGSGYISKPEVLLLFSALAIYDHHVSTFETINKNRAGMLSLSDLQYAHRNVKTLMSIVANVRERLGMPPHDYITLSREEYDRDYIIVSREEYVRLRIPGCSKRATNAFVGAVPGAYMPIELLTAPFAVMIMKDAVLASYGRLSLANFAAKLRDMGADDFPADVLFVLLDIDHSGYLEIGEAKGIGEAFTLYRTLWAEVASVDANRDGVVTYMDLALGGVSAPMLTLLADVRVALGLPVFQNPDTILILLDEFVRLSIPGCPLTATGNFWVDPKRTL